jgi:hypothetical protein
MKLQLPIYSKIAQTGPMETTLEAKKQRIMRRLEATIESANEILVEINQELRNVIVDGARIEQTAVVYDTWISKD